MYRPFQIRAKYRIEMFVSEYVLQFDGLSDTERGKFDIGPTGGDLSFVIGSGTVYKVGYCHHIRKIIELKFK